jgi:glycosyltransferase involved in cell wall biosynthesis
VPATGKPSGLRIGLISTPWIPVPPPSYGGTEAIVDRLARGLTAAGHDVVLAATGDSTCPVPTVAASHAAAPALMGESSVALAHTVNAYEALRDRDLVHDHTTCGPLYRHRPENLPVVTTNHNPFTAEWAVVYRDIARDVPVIAISQEHARTAFPIPIAAVILHGLDVESVPLGTGRGGYAVFLGRMCADKGVREAILCARRAGVPLQIAAKMQSPEEHEYFHEVVEPLLGGDVEYVGELGPKEKYLLLGEAFVAINPAQWCEPFGLVTVESLATGTPVVGTRLGSTPELIGDGVTGFLRDDIGGLADAVLAAADLDRGTCRREAETRFSTARMVDDHVRFYRRVLGR